MIVDATKPIKEAMSVARRAKRKEFHRESIGVIGIIYESRPNVTVDATCC